MADPELQRGWIDGELELAGLALWLTRIDARSGASPALVRTRLRELAGRINGNHVVHMRAIALGARRGRRCPGRAVGRGDHRRSGGLGFR